MVNIKYILLPFCALLITFSSVAQFKDYTFGEGLRYTAKDSSFYIKASARFQTLFVGEWNVNNDDLANIGNYNSNFLTRRARLKFDGFAYTPKLKYKVELGVSNRDLNNQGPAYFGTGGSMILDAFLKWNFYKGFSIKGGQYKLEGNRERLISSANMQFVDRSLLNSRFTLDRGLGTSLLYDKTIGKQFELMLSATVSKGEGRNVIADNIGGYQTTFKAEIMPFGQFKSKGAYKGGDLSREQKPKLAIAAAYDLNNGVIRSRSNKGSFFPENAELKDLTTIFADFMFKYKGLSVMGEYVHRKTNDDSPGIFDELGNQVGTYYTGEAFNIQVGYLLKNNVEFAGRYTYLSPQNLSVGTETNNYVIAVSKYIREHSLKVQTDLGYYENQFTDDALMWRVQVEFGF